MNKSEQVLWCATVISNLDRSGDPVCSPVPKAKAYNYYNGETARGCIRSSCDLSTGCGSNLRSRIVTSPAIPSSMITVCASKRGALQLRSHVRKAQSLSKLRSVIDRNAGEISDVTAKSRGRFKIQLIFFRTTRYN